MRAVERLEIVVPRAASQLFTLPLPVQRIARLCDGERTIEAVCEASALSPDITTRVVERLLQLGVVAKHTGARREPETFTHEEEQFFQSSFDHLLHDVYEGDL